MCLSVFHWNMRNASFLISLLYAFFILFVYSKLEWKANIAFLNVKICQSCFIFYLSWHRTSIRNSLMHFLLCLKKGFLMNSLVSPFYINTFSPSPICNVALVHLGLKGMVCYSSSKLGHRQFRRFDYCPVVWNLLNHSPHFRRWLHIWLDNTLEYRFSMTKRYWGTVG